jgi:hypothetical protein
MNDAGVVDGLDATLGISRVRREMLGVQVAGAALVEGDARGLQFAGVNFVQGNASGVQLGWLVNHAGVSMCGLQSAMVNSASKLQGLQWGGANVARGRVQGAQLAFVNIGGDVDGTQVGLVNIARRIRGAQVGLVNISDSLYGAGIGPVVLAGNMRLQGDVWVTESGLSHAGLLWGTENSYLLCGAVFDSPARHRVSGIDLGLGGRLRGEHAFVSADLVASSLVRSLEEERKPSGRRYLEADANELLTLRMCGGWRLLRHLEVYGGLAANLLISDGAPEERKYVAPVGSGQAELRSDLRFWPGAVFGIRI